TAPDSGGGVELAALRDRADAAARAGRPDEALTAWLEAAPRLEGTPAWREAWPAERERLEGAARAWALARCRGIELQAAAEEGALDEVDALAAALKSTSSTESDRAPLADERALAERVRAAAQREGGLRLRGFSPDRVELEGQRCALECTL